MSTTRRKSTKSRRAKTLPREQAPKQTGRPPLDIDPETVQGMATIGGTNEEIAEYLQISTDTLTRRFAELLVKARSEMKLRLRRAQFRTAVGSAKVAGNPTMQIWLGKQHLKQSDKVETPVDPDGNELPPRNRMRVGNVWIEF